MLKAMKKGKQRGKVSEKRIMRDAFFFTACMHYPMYVQKFPSEKTK